MAFQRRDREFLLEWIQIYRGLPVLWDINSKDYQNREKKKRAYDVLLDKYREMVPEATKVDVKKKINSLRSNFRKECKKRQQLKRENPKDPIPKSWSYDALCFVRNEENEDDSDNVDDSMDATEEETEQFFFFEDTADSRSSVEIKKEKTDRQKSNDEDPTSQPSSSYTIVTKAKQKRRYEEADSPGKHQRDSIELDEYKTWALACAADLQKMQTTQQIYAKKAIAEIIMEGRLGLLTRNSVKINDPLV